MEFCSLLWGIPFLGIIFSMSFMPLLCPNFWHRYNVYVPAFWTLIYLFFVGYVFSPTHIFSATYEPIFDHYIPFIVLITALYVVSGGIYIDFPRSNGPMFNVTFLFFGSLLSGLIGTTGAATLLIRPLLRANMQRKYKTHILVFFIFLVANIGGVSTPLGDPPLFIGFLEGVDFFWFIKHVYQYQFATTLILCFLFFSMDMFLLKTEQYVPSSEEHREHSLVFRGKRNAILILCILVTVIFCNFKNTFVLFGEHFSYASLLRNVILILITIISLLVTPRSIREKNSFSLEPMSEIMNLFASVFITVTPIIAMLHQGIEGPLNFIFDWIAPGGTVVASKCFWASGLLSSILDNAPTFLIFFHMLSGNAYELMTVKAHLLTAISVSTVFMGAITYIGNAPNLMVRSIAANYGIKAPSFLGYILWSVAFLIPIFLAISILL